MKINAEIAKTIRYILQKIFDFFSKKHLTYLSIRCMIQANQRKGVKNMTGQYENTERYELKLIDELATEKLSWSSLWKAIQLTALIANA